MRVYIRITFLVLISTGLAACSSAATNTSTFNPSDTPRPAAIMSQPTATVAVEETATSEPTAPPATETSSPSVTETPALDRSLEIIDVAVEDGIVIIDIAISGFELRFVQGDVSGATGHLHVYVDRPPPMPGLPIPLGPADIIHSLQPKIRISGLSAGPHQLWIVVGDGVDNLIVPPEPVLVGIEIP